MLVFIDESGHPHPADQTERPVLLAVCIKEAVIGQLMRAMYSMKRSLLSNLPLRPDEIEGKATALLNRYSLTKVPAKREYAESLFEMLRDFDLKVFAIVMERPLRKLYRGPDFLQTQYRWLLERIERFIEREHPDHFGIPIFDGQDSTNNKIFSDSFTSFMMKNDAGRAMKQIVPNPLFVDSSLTPGIRVADFFAYAIRLNEEHKLYQSQIGDPYLSAIKRYAAIVRGKTLNYEREDGLMWYGIATMDASKFVYASTGAQPPATPPEPPPEELSLPADTGSQNT